MNSNVDKEEAQALMDALRSEAKVTATPAGEVAARDFSKPKRMPAAERERIFALVSKSAAQLRTALCGTLRGNYSLELTSVEEVSGEDVLQNRPLPWAALRFECAKQPGWVFWNSAGAVSVIESLLGLAEPKVCEPRELSKVEHSLLLNLLTPLSKAIAALLGASIENLIVVTNPKEFGSWRDGGDKSDLQRILLQLTIQGPVGPSEISIYFPGFSSAPQRPGARPQPSEMPGHLGQVEVTLWAQLASDVALDELLSLEVGDVIPMSDPGGRSVALLVEGEEAAVGALGRHRGQLAVRIERLGPKQVAHAALDAQGAKNKHG